MFNPDIYVQELLRQGKSLKDAREGGCSGCIEVGAFGKEAYVLTGYLNVPKILEVTLNNGIDPVTGKVAGIETGDPRDFESYDELYEAFKRQLNYIVDTKIRVSNYIDRMFAKYAPAPFLSVVIEDCISKGRDYYDAGPRYNTNYIQCTGLGTVTDSLSALKKHVYEKQSFSMERVLDAVAKISRARSSCARRFSTRPPSLATMTIMPTISPCRFMPTCLQPSTASRTSRARPSISTCSPRPAISTLAK